MLHTIRWPYLCVSFSFMPPPRFSSSCYLEPESLRQRLPPAGHLYGILEVSLIHVQPLLRLVKPSTQSPGPWPERCSWIFNKPIVLVFEWIGTTGWVATLSGQLGSDMATQTAGGQGEVGDQVRLGLTCCIEGYWGKSLWQLLSKDKNANTEIISV